MHLNSVFADSQCVPELNGFVAGSGHNLAIVGRKCYAEDILRVTNKAPRRPTTAPVTKANLITIY